MNMYVGCYSLDLYCDQDNPAHAYKEFPKTYTSELGTKARSTAKKDGWIFHRDSTMTCPKCNSTKGATP